MQNDAGIGIDTKMMASFRIERADWEKFGLIVKGERLTATQVLTDYIEQCLAAGKSFYRVNPSNHEVVDTPTSEEQTQSLINQAIKPLMIDISNLQSQLAKLSTEVKNAKASPSKSVKPK
jgi:hypothetical protein